ncbi:hypothetical protein SS50377_26508 [Spironucleus salmonicida]|uniref:Uncharacterized protein n=1 Tax=Spironucleus salmonicida TaxID=348837 RepID=V6LAD3_9EUKA|nr:hypothetical protein SS50377_26508 [Spironucleus salmonicida]|eukprot:EST41362.1 Hypothetical protein SS50377_19077 [Spironucleus salmonicida]
MHRSNKFIPQRHISSNFDELLTQNQLTTFSPLQRYKQQYQRYVNHQYTSFTESTLDRQIRLKYYYLNLDATTPLKQDPYSIKEKCEDLLFINKLNAIQTIQGTGINSELILEDLNLSLDFDLDDNAINGQKIINLPQPLDQSIQLQSFAVETQTQQLENLSITSEQSIQVASEPITIQKLIPQALSVQNQLTITKLESLGFNTQTESKAALIQTVDSRKSDFGTQVYHELDVKKIDFSFVDSILQGIKKQ